MSKRNNKDVPLTMTYGNTQYTPYVVQVDWGFTHKPLTYLACPYSHKDKRVRERRFKAVTLVTGSLMKQGVVVFSPITYSHIISIQDKLPIDFKFWEKFDTAFLSCCSRMIVLMLDGWKKSKGVKAEIKYAKKNGIKIEYMEDQRETKKKRRLIKKPCDNCFKKDSFCGGFTNTDKQKMRCPKFEDWINDRSKKNGIKIEYMEDQRETKKKRRLIKKPCDNCFKKDYRCGEPCKDYDKWSRGNPKKKNMGV